MSHTDGGMEEIEQDILRNMLKALFGDCADYVGQTVEEMPERRRANVVRLCSIALKRLGDDIARPGSVPPRVIGCLLGDGSFCRDFVASEYWGGILAGARGDNPRDDRAARKLQSLARLGEYAIRSHYLFFTTLRLLLRNHFSATELAAIDWDDEKTRFRLAAFIPAGYYILAMDYGKDEILRMPRITSDVLTALGMEFLLDGSNTGPDHHLKRFFTSPAIRGEGIVFTPGVQGIQLLLWAFGGGDMPHAYFLDDGFDCRIEGLPMGVDEAGLVYTGAP